MIGKSKVIISTKVDADLRGTIDLYSLNGKTGKITWFIVSDDPIEDQRFNAVFNQVLSLSPDLFIDVETLILISSRFTWTVRQIVAKQREIKTNFGNVAIKLATMDEDGKITVLEQLEVKSPYTFRRR